MHRFLALVLTLTTSLGASQAADSSKTDVEGRRKALTSLLTEQWDYSLSTNPEYASVIGDKRWNDKSNDYSKAAVQKNLVKTAEFLKRFEAIDTAGFPEQEQLNKTLMIRELKETLDGAKFKPWETPVTQFYGPHIGLPQNVSYLPFDTVKDFDDYIARLKNLPKQFDDVMANMRAGLADGLMPPKILLDQVVPQAHAIASQESEKSPFAQPLDNFPKTATAEEKKRVHDQTLAAIHDLVIPAYAKFEKFVKEEYAPKGRKDPGVWALPDGPARYAFLVHHSTTTNLTAEEIHTIGLKEVARIEKEMLGIANKMGYKDIKSFNAAIDKNPDLHGHSRQELLDLYTRFIDQMYGKLPQLFGRLPKAKVVVKPTEDFREASAAGAEYNQGTPDGSRPGTVNVNTGDFANRKTLNVETTAYHEGVPGHHMQIAIAQELESLPPFRQQGGNTAYVEGWALYSEDLGRDAGFFKDPYQMYGHYLDEMLRAIRLVVDTGLHAKHWTREQVVQFFHDHSGTDEVEVQAETDRYIAIPSQALGYKIGQLTIVRLRDKAKAKLGAKFDIRRFHDEILGAGALPMDILETRIDGWIASEAKRAAVH